jgi:Replication initiator protein, pSAM2
MFLTLTCPSYGRVREDGTPADSGSYDCARAARDAIHFPALFDRFMQNLRRFTDPARYTWEPVTLSDPDHMPPAQRLLHIVAERQRWHAALTQARARASGPPGPNLSATGRAA